MSIDRSTFRVTWSSDDGEYVCLVDGFPSLSWIAPTAGEAIAGAERLLADVLADMCDSGEPVPARHYRQTTSHTVRDCSCDAAKASEKDFRTTGSSDWHSAS